MFDKTVFLCYFIIMKNKMTEKTDKVYKFIVDYIEKNGFPPSIREICAKLGIKSTATAYDYIAKLKERGLLDKSPMKKRAISPINKQNSPKRSENNKFVSIPIVGTVTAGSPIFAVENLDGYCPLPEEFRGAEDDFALRVSGESMINAGIYDRDLIIVKKCDTADNGSIVVALIDDSATVKRFYKKNGKIVLHPENDAMEDMIFDDVKILGIVKGLIRKF